MGLPIKREDSAHEQNVHPIRIHSTFDSPHSSTVGALVSVDVPFFVHVPKHYMAQGLRGAVLEEIADQLRDQLVQQMRELYDA